MAVAPLHWYESKDRWTSEVSVNHMEALHWAIYSAQPASEVLPQGLLASEMPCGATSLAQKSSTDGPVRWPVNHMEALH